MVLTKMPDCYKGKTRWLCKCECGTLKITQGAQLRNGCIKSCGCLNRERLALFNSLYDNTTHGLTTHGLYQVWKNMIRRCYNCNDSQFQYYGNRNINVCFQWRHSPTEFIGWALKNGWRKGLFLDRINNDGNYIPENCRFVDAGLSARNKRVLSKTNTSGYRGVSFHKRHKKYQANIKTKGQSAYLGLFKNPIQAAIAYDAATMILDDGRPPNFQWPLEV